MTFVHPSREETHIPFGNFAFHVNFIPLSKGSHPKLFKNNSWGGFSEISGLEASMEHRAIKEGGRNYGTVMRAGQTTFGTVILKRGIVSAQFLWQWWAYFAGANGANDAVPNADNRCNMVIGLTRKTLANPAERSQKIPKLTDRHVAWQLRNVMPVKFKIGDFNAKGTDVAIEELHVVHEGLDLDIGPATAGGGRNG
jgi:phage tail-like protein